MPTVTSDVRTFLVVAAEKFELRYIRPREDVAWKFVANGPGAALAGAGMDAIGAGVAAVLNVGLCGALAEDLEVGDIVVGTAINGIPIEIPEARLRHRLGPILSVDHVVQTAEEKRELGRTGAIAVEMEAAAALDRARRWGVPFYCVRAVSDAVDEGFSLDLNAARGVDGRFLLSRILAQAVGNPWVRVPELFRLKRSSDIASSALGVFIANCSF